MEATDRLKVFFRRPLNCAIFVITTVVLLVSARLDYLLFHTVVEGIAVIVAFMIFIIATTTYQYSQNNYLLFIGITAMFIGVIDSFHLMTYQGMGIFPIDSPNIATQLWIAGRYLQGISLFLATFFLNRVFPRTLVFWIYAVITGALIASIMWLHIFPQCYIVGQGLTSFKVASEWIISIIVLAAILRLYREKQQSNRLLYQLMMLSMTIFILSELSFTLYSDVYGIMNFLGHILKFISYSLVFTGIVFLGVEDPYRMISDRLKANANLDLLTGLYNRRGFDEFYPREIARAGREGNHLGVMMIDLDNFKNINDQYGHQIGDYVLQRFASVLQASVRETDIVCRMGGDEFLIMANNDLDGMKALQIRMMEHAQEWINNDARLDTLGVSSGISIWDPTSPRDMDELITEADSELYREKALHQKLSLAQTDSLLCTSYTYQV